MLLLRIKISKLSKSFTRSNVKNIEIEQVFEILSWLFLILDCSSFYTYVLSYYLESDLNTGIERSQFI
jgi:hypothetical protein